MAADESEPADRFMASMNAALILLFPSLQKLLHEIVESASAPAIGHGQREFVEPDCDRYEARLRRVGAVHPGTLPTTPPDVARVLPIKSPW